MTLIGKVSEFRSPTIGRLTKFVVGSVFSVLLVPSTAVAQGPEPIAVERIGLRPLDWFLIIVYACSTILLGIYYSCRQTSTREYFLGNGKMNPFLVGISLFATLLSTISYLSMPGESSGKGPVVLCTFLALPLVYLVVAHLMLPVYMRHRVTSAYELLESRLGLSIRLLAQACF